MGGVPAKKIETVEEYYQKIREHVVPTFGMSNEEKKNYLINNCPELFNDSNH